MKKQNSNLILLSMVFAVSLVIANAVSAKLFNTGFSLFGLPILLPAAAVCYAVTFLMTDVIGEIWGAKKANEVVKFGFIVQIIATLMIIVVQVLPPANLEQQEAYIKLLGQNWIFVVSSLTAYICSQTWDVYFFHRVRNKYIKKYRTTKGGKWIWNNLSTMTSQIIDTAVFLGLAFGVGFKWLWNGQQRKELVIMMIGYYVFKFILASLDTPIFYLLTRNSESIIQE